MSLFFCQRIEYWDHEFNTANILLILTNQIAGIMIFDVITFTLRHDNDYPLIRLVFYRSYFWRESKTLKLKLTFEVRHITNTKRCNICWNNFSVVRSSNIPNNQVLPDKEKYNFNLLFLNKKLSAPLLQEHHLDHTEQL